MKIAFKNVSLQYGDAPILRDISFEISPETRLAIVGESGAGKSSIAKLLMRATDPTTGEIQIADKPFPQYKLQSVLRHIGIVLQRPEMISGNVRENILFALHPEDFHTVCDEKIWSVLDLISPSFRNRLANGLDTRVGKNGLQLSGGEQQRICIARALIKNPEFLIIDEATASLDACSEQVVQRGIDTSLQQGISAVVIAHRLSTQRNCNKFLILKRPQDCTDSESQIEMICNSATEAYEQSVTYRKLGDAQGFRP